MRKINKWLSLLLLSCLLFGVVAPAHAASSAALEFDTSYKNSRWTVTVKLTGNKRPNMIEFCLEYDSSKLKLRSVEAGSAFSSANAPVYSTPKTGRVLFAWEALTGLKDGKLLVLTFSAKSGAKGEAEISFNEDYNTVFMDKNREDIALTLRRTQIDLDDADDDDDDNYIIKPKTPKPTDDWDSEDWGNDDWDDDWDDWNPDPTPAPWETASPDGTPIPLGDDEEQQVTYTLDDMTIFVGQICTTQEGFLFLSSDPNVLAVEEGQLRGVSEGISTVTAYKNGAAVGSCTITVQKDPALQEETDTKEGGSNFLKIVLWSGIALILIALIWIAIILIKRRRY